MCVVDTENSNHSCHLQVKTLISNTIDNGFRSRYFYFKSSLLLRGRQERSEHFGEISLHLGEIMTRYFAIQSKFGLLIIFQASQKFKKIEIYYSKLFAISRQKFKRKTFSTIVVGVIWAFD